MPAETDEPLESWLHLLARCNIVRQGEHAGIFRSFSPQVGLQRLRQPGAEDKAVHLVEDDFRVFEDGRPAEALDIEPTRPRQCRNPECDYGYLLLHGFT